MEKCGVYQIWCNRSGNFYVGSSKHIYRRWLHHRTLLRKGKSPCVHLQHAWNKYGEECFRFTILEECAEEALERREQFFLDTLKPAYNSITDIARRYGEDQRRKIAAALKARAAARTHCPHGHLYDEANTYIGKKGEKVCRACNAERVGRIYASETPEQREARRQRAKKKYEENYEARRAVQNEYAAVNREAKRVYDKANRAVATARKREARQNESPEQRERRLRMKRESHHRRKKERRGAIQDWTEGGLH